MVITSAGVVMPNHEPVSEGRNGSEPNGAGDHILAPAASRPCGRITCPEAALKHHSTSTCLRKQHPGLFAWPDCSAPLPLLRTNGEYWGNFYDGNT